VGYDRVNPPLFILFICSSLFFIVFIFDIFSSSNFLLISSRAVFESLPIFKFFNSSYENLKGFINDFPNLVDGSRLPNFDSNSESFKAI